MTSYIILFFLHFASINLSLGDNQTTSVRPYGLPELTKDILEKIKAATGQPINTNRFITIQTEIPVAAPSREHEILTVQPYTKVSKILKASHNNKFDSGFFHSLRGKKGSGHEKDHHYEVAEKGEKGEDLLKHVYGDYFGNEHKYHEGRFVKKNHHKGKGSKKGGKSKKGKKRGKFHVEKGFRDIYHKDEEKKSDYFWNNKHEEGKWIQYGLVNKKKDQTNDKKDKEKKVNDKKEESSYEKNEKNCTKCKVP